MDKPPLPVRTGDGAGTLRRGPAFGLGKGKVGGSLGGSVG